MNNASRECFSDFALQEFAQGRLATDIRNELSAHVAMCAECRDALRAIEVETVLLRDALAALDPAADDPGISNETLALYATGSLDFADAAALEARLNRSRALLARLIALNQETNSVRGVEDADTPTEAPSEPRGEILRMPKRTSTPVTVQVTKRASGGETS